VKNGTETDKDCGGSCPDCAVTKACLVGGDCQSGACAGGVCVDAGCADGQREGFTTLANIAACSGGWSVAGVKSAPSYTPACGRQGGDDGSNPNGTGCSVVDLCAVGWHVCDSPADVTNSAGIASACSDPAQFPAQTFFITRQSGSGSLACDNVGNNDVFGCGNLGTATSQASCLPINRTVGAGCSNLGNGWACGQVAAANVTEALTVTKSLPGRGGALCCRDSDIN
jgi:hypothetical protein